MSPLAGYSGRPLAQKLGIKEGHLVSLLAAPSGFAEHGLGPLPDGVVLHERLVDGADVVLTFRTSRAALEADRVPLTRAIGPAACWWVCWPKKASKVPTDITEDVIREIALPHGLVDTKVCAVDHVWSGLRLVIRRERRTGTVADLLSG